MKRLTYSEFSKRAEELAKARAIFVDSGFTNNISVAFDIYMNMLAEEEIQQFISTAMAGSRPMTPLDDYVRPKCPECGIDLRLALGVDDMDGKKWPTAWYCEQCFTYFYNDKTVIELMQELKKK